jgi:hypothetical protein
VATPAVEVPKETFACLIIDDPLLSRLKYGCLDYTRLLEEMKVHKFFTEIAFIPWNYRRSDSKTARLFADNTEYYGICVHGCDHSGNEFGGENYEEFCDLASTALWRMDQHKELTGLTYDPVMVFPQGRFSSVAIQAIRDSGYHAAFNSTLKATNARELPAVEFQKPATVAYHGFPLFLRRYPKNRSGILQDLASGRPIILVEHHGTFRNGYKALTDVVDWINGLADVRWKSLSYIAHHYCGNIAVAARQRVSPQPPGLRKSAMVATRRFLSETRDRYVETNQLAARLYKLVRGRG